LLSKPTDVMQVMASVKRILYNKHICAGGLGEWWVTNMWVKSYTCVVGWCVAVGYTANPLTF